MNVLVLLIDSDVLMDFLTDREPFAKDAHKIVEKSKDKTASSFMAAHSVTNIFYLLRKVSPAPERRQRLMKLCQSIYVMEIGHQLITNALANTEFDDFEDCLQAECARVVNADYIVTRNIRDYAHSKVPAILPENLLILLET